MAGSRPWRPSPGQPRPQGGDADGAGNIDHFASKSSGCRALWAGRGAEAAGLVPPVDQVPAGTSGRTFLARAPRPVTVRTSPALPGPASALPGPAQPSRPG